MFYMAEIYHVLSRGVDKRKIFLCDEDRYRFIHDLFEFNDTEPVNNLTYRFRNKNNKDIVSPYIGSVGKGRREYRRLLVNLHAFCLMPNHYHLLVSARVKDGVTSFMRKLNIGYAKYFNGGYERTGALFEGRYKSVPIQSDAHFIHIPYYIHLNPLDLIMPEWRKREISDSKEAMKFLGKYKWSSFQDYIGKKNFPSVTQREFLNEFFEGPAQYKKDTLKWLKEMNLEEIKQVTLE